MKITNTNFIYKLSVIRQSAFSFLENELAEAGANDLPPSFGDILHIIDSKGSPYVKDIVRLSYKDKSTVSTILNQLEKKGYAEKIADPEDGRKIMVRLTENAKQQVKTMARISENLKEKIFKDMSHEEQSILFLLLGKIEQNLKRGESDNV